MMPAVGARGMLSEKGEEPPPAAADGLACSQFLSRRLNSRGCSSSAPETAEPILLAYASPNCRLEPTSPARTVAAGKIYILQRYLALGFHLPLSGRVLWRILETTTLPEPLGFHTTLLDSFLWLLQETIPLPEVLGFHLSLIDGLLWHIQETIPIPEVLGFHLSLIDGLLWRILETSGVGIAVVGSSERVSGSVGLGSKQPGPTLPDIPADGRPTELPAVLSSVFAATPSLTFGLFPKVDGVYCYERIGLIFKNYCWSIAVKRLSSGLRHRFRTLSVSFL